ncbi:MAG: hypothetical protein ACXWPM_06520 [Bdellovibrionota bacterium]
MRIFALATLALMFFFAGTRDARAWTAESILDAGVEFFPSITNGPVGNLGEFLHFQVESREHWFRPNFSAQLEVDFGTNNHLINGYAMGGFELIADSADYIKPFIGVNGVFGWANYFTTNQTFVNILYGFSVDAGTEIRFSPRATSKGLRITTGWRSLWGTVGGGVMGQDLNAVSISLGITF